MQSILVAAVAVHLSCKRLPVRYRASWSRSGDFFYRILLYLVVGVVWMCVGDEIVFGFGVAKLRECDDVSSKNTVKKAEMCRPCSLPLRSTCPVSVCLCDTEHLGRGAVVGLMLGTIRPVI